MLEVIENAQRFVCLTEDEMPVNAHAGTICYVIEGKKKFIFCSGKWHDITGVA